jgi:antitoxin VapB
MITTDLIKEGNSQIVELPKEFEFKGIEKVQIRKKGNALIITPVRKNWTSFAQLQKGDENFLTERPDVFNPDTVMF